VRGSKEVEGKSGGEAKGEKEGKRKGSRKSFLQLISCLPHH
jgi:hypothetical protein